MMGDIDYLPFSSAFALLCNLKDHLLYAFPELCKAYTVALAIPISLCILLNDVSQHIQ